MLSIDTNILLPAVVGNHAAHAKAAEFINSLKDQEGIAISEFILLELYVLLRNPVVMPSPLGAKAAAETCQSLRSNPAWQVCGFPQGSAQFHNELWAQLTQEPFARRRAYDFRTALALQRFGVIEFATVNVKDFEGFGFARVWNPLH